MLSTLAIIAAITNLSTLLGVFGYRKRAKSLKKANSQLKTDNGQLLEAVADALSDHVSEDHVREYLKAVDKAGHKWKLLSTQEFEWGNKQTGFREDELATYRCERCSAIHRVWGRGHGAVDKPEAQGMWFDATKLTTDDSRRFLCDAVATKVGESEFSLEKNTWTKVKEKVEKAARLSASTSKPAK